MSQEMEPLKICCRKCQQRIDVSLLEPFSKVACPTCGTELRVPKRFDRYLLERIWGIGGMAKVYRAFDPELARRVAIKVFNVDAADQADYAGMMLNEARLAARINHSAVIPIYSCGVCEGKPFIVMQFMARGSLEVLINQHLVPREPEKIFGWLATAATGLFVACKENIVHHDVKPGNILLDADDTVKIGDFGLANLAGDSEVGQMGSWGSPIYVSPERLQTGQEDYKGDIFSLGVTAYELLTLDFPFGETGESIDLLERRRARKYVAVADRNPKVSRAISDLIDRMMSFLPGDRPEYPEIIGAFEFTSLPVVPKKSFWQRLFGKD